MGKKKKFLEHWASQTDIGKRFGLSGVAVGKILVENGLKDPGTREATEKALQEEWCVATPLKNGARHFMWSIKKVRSLISTNHHPVSKAEMIANDLIATIKSAQRALDAGNDKLGFLSMEFAFNEIPEASKQAVYVALVDKGYEEYAKGWISTKSGSPA